MPAGRFSMAITPPPPHAFAGAGGAAAPSPERSDGGGGARAGPVRHSRVAPARRKGRLPRPRTAPHPPPCPIGRPRLPLHTSGMIRAEAGRGRSSPPPAAPRAAPQSCHRVSPRSTGRYESDLKELYGAEEWVAKAEAARTSATAAYVAELQTAAPVSLVAAAFIIYGALVVGGGKQTQLKARQPPSRPARTLDASADNRPLAPSPSYILGPSSIPLAHTLGAQGPSWL